MKLCFCRKIRLVRIIFILSIAILIVIPLAKLDYKKTIDNIENRNLAILPKIIKDGQFNVSIGADIDSYFNDRFGKRKFFIKLKEDLFSINKITSSSSPDGKIYGFNDDWFFVEDFLSLNFDKMLLYVEKHNLEVLQKHYNCPVYVLVFPF